MKWKITKKVRPTIETTPLPANTATILEIVEPLTPEPSQDYPISLIPETPEKANTLSLAQDLSPSPSPESGEGRNLNGVKRRGEVTLPTQGIFPNPGDEVENSEESKANNLNTDLKKLEREVQELNQLLKNSSSQDPHTLTQTHKSTSQKSNSILPYFYFGGLSICGIAIPFYSVWIKQNYSTNQMLITNISPTTTNLYRNPIS